MLRNSKKSNTAGLGWSDVRTTVYLSGVWTSVNQLLMNSSWAAGSLGSRTRRMLNLTSSLVNSRPLWNWTPLRRFNWIRMVSGATSQLSASIGIGLRWLSYAVSVSYIWKTPTWVGP